MSNMKTVSLYLANTDRVHTLANASRVLVQFRNFAPSVVTGRETCVIDFINEYFQGNPAGRHFVKTLKDAEQEQ